MSKSKILILISGSIAAYKACYLISKLKQNGFEIKIAASKSALKFIGLPSLEGLAGTKIAHDTFEDGAAMDHINLIRWADLVIAIPASANFINKLASGIGDDLISTLALAHDFKKPFLICPAMNTQMYLHPITQKSVKALREYGFAILETQSGVLACGEVGLGKLLDPDLIYNEIINSLNISGNVETPAPKAKKRVLITSGGTIEAIDNVRAITNSSSGKTGAALAEALDAFGFEICFISAKTGAKPDKVSDIREFSDFKSLEAQLYNAIENEEFDAIIHCAAVSDYSVIGVFDENGQKLGQNGKISSSLDEVNIKLKRNPKLLNQIKAKSKNRNCKLIGFKLTGFETAEEVKKIVEKQFIEADCDYIVQNGLNEINDEKSSHKYNLYTRNLQAISIAGSLELASAIAGEIK